MFYLGLDIRGGNVQGGGVLFPMYSAMPMHVLLHLENQTLSLFWAMMTQELFDLECSHKGVTYYNHCSSTLYTPTHTKN